MLYFLPIYQVKSKPKKKKKTKSKKVRDYVSIIIEMSDYEHLGVK